MSRTVIKLIHFTNPKKNGSVWRKYSLLFFSGETEYLIVSRKPANDSRRPPRLSSQPNSHLNFSRFSDFSLLSCQMSWSGQALESMEAVSSRFILGKYHWKQWSFSQSHSVHTHTHTFTPGGCLVQPVQPQFDLPASEQMGVRGLVRVTSVIVVPCSLTFPAQIYIAGVGSSWFAQQNLVSARNFTCS